MKEKTLLVITSLLSIVFLILHLTDDYIRGISKVQWSANFIVFPVLVLLLCGALLLAERRSGYIIQLFTGILALGMPALHFRGAKINDIAQASGGFFTISTLLILGTTGLFGIVLAVRALYRGDGTARA
jgi:hypothetical protein